MIDAMGSIDQIHRRLHVLSEINYKIGTTPKKQNSYEEMELVTNSHFF
jgi:hypothetical protein